MQNVCSLEDMAKLMKRQDMDCYMEKEFYTEFFKVNKIKQLKF